MALTWRQFLAILEQKGYEIRMGRKYPTLRPPGKEGFVRFKTLGKAYTPEAIRQRILYPKRPFTPAAGWRGRLHGNYRKARKLTGLRACVLSVPVRAGRTAPQAAASQYAVRQDIRNLDKRIRQMEFLSRHGIDTLAQLNAYRQGSGKDRVRPAGRTPPLHKVESDDAIETRLEQITQALKPLRRDIRLCRQIARTIGADARTAKPRGGISRLNRVQNRIRPPNRITKGSPIKPDNRHDGGMPMKMI